jgi:hypothetical protein
VRNLLLVSLLAASSAALAQADPPRGPEDLDLWVGKRVVVGRLPLCRPKTLDVDVAYMGKPASIVSLKGSQVADLPAATRRQMAPSVLAQIDDTRKGGILVFRFDDGVVLDSCVELGFAKLTSELELAPGEVWPDPPALPTAMANATSTATATTPAESQGGASAVATAPQQCPVAVIRLKSGNGGLRQAFVDALTTSEFQRQLDETTHDGVARHYLEVTLRNTSDKAIDAIEDVAIYTDKMGDETARDTLLSQNTRPIAPGKEERASVMDRESMVANGIGQVTLYVSRVRFSDGTFWRDDGSQSCAASSRAK